MVFVALYRVILLMLEVSKVHRELSIQSNVTHVKGVERSSKWSYTSLLITFLIFNGFSIHKKFWKTETYSFPTIPSNTIYVGGVESSSK